MVARPNVGLKETLRLLLKNIDKMSVILPSVMLLFFSISLILDLHQIPNFIPYNSSSDKLSIYSIDLSRDYLEKISLGLMTSLFSAWLVKYIIEKNASNRNRRNGLVKAYRGIYSLIAIVIEAAFHMFILGGMSPTNNPYFEQIRGIHYSHGMIDPVLSRRIPPHNSTHDMIHCVNIISAVLNSDNPIIIENWPRRYSHFKQYIEGYLDRGQKELIEDSLSEAIRLNNDTAIIATIYHFSAITEKNPFWQMGSFYNRTISQIY